MQNIPIFEQSQSAPAAGASQGLATVLPNYSKTVGDTILNEVGVKLTVVPRIAGASNVLISVQPEISSVDTKIATDTLNGQVNTSPIFDRRTIITEASVPSGYTLVLGGLDDDVMAKTYTKVPGLGDLPGLGSLFRSNTKDHTRDTILIFRHPDHHSEPPISSRPRPIFCAAKTKPCRPAKTRPGTGARPTIGPNQNRPLSQSISPESHEHINTGLTSSDARKRFILCLARSSRPVPVLWHGPLSSPASLLALARRKSTYSETNVTVTTIGGGPPPANFCASRPVSWMATPLKIPNLTARWPWR